MTMHRAPRDHVPVRDDMSRIRQSHRGWAFALAGGWLTLAIAAAFFAFGV